MGQLEEQERALERAREECASYQREAESARQSHAVAELTADERKKRVEFLENALEQAVEYGRFSIETSRNPGFSAVVREAEDGLLVHVVYLETVPELAAYLEEKNG